MRVQILDLCLHELSELPRKAKKKLKAKLIALERQATISNKHFKKLSGISLYEIRFSGEGRIFRAIGGFASGTFIVSRIFCKKTQKTPQKELWIAQKRIDNLLKQE